MALIEFKNKPNTDTPINDINLNQLRAIYKEQYPKTLKLDAQRRKIWKK